MCEQWNEKVCTLQQEEEAEIPNEEYEAQFYGFAPTDVYEGMKGLITDRFEYAINKLEKQLQKIPHTVLPEEELNEGIKKLKLITAENIDATLGKLKKHLLGNIFKIPPDLLLPEDAEQAVPVSSEEKEALLQEIENLKMQLKTEKYMEAALQEELKEQELVIKMQKQLLKKEFSVSLQNALDEERDKLTFLASKLPSIQEAINSFHQNVDALELETRFQENFESDAFV